MALIKHTTENILVSGYVREYQKGFGSTVPKLVASILCAYCKKYEILQIGKELYNNDFNAIKQFNIFNSNMICNEISVSIDKLYPTDVSSVIFRTNSKNDQINSSKSTCDLFTYNEDYFRELVSSNSMPERLVNIITNKNITQHINSDIIDFKYGGKHALFLTITGKVYAMGSNDSGQCGLSKDIVFAETPTLINTFEESKIKIKKIACGELHSLFVDENGKLLCCGYNSCGQLGLSTTESPTANADDAQQSHMEFDNEFLENEFNDEFLENEIHFEYDSDSSDNDFFQEIQQCFYEPITNPYFEENMTLFSKIYCGSYHSLCISVTGEVYTFGHNGFGNLGNGNCSELGQGEFIPFKLDINEKIINANCGNNHNILLTENNNIIVFGDNNKNQCSIQMNKKNKINIPFMLSKEKEFGMNKSKFSIETIICVQNVSLAIIDRFKRNG